MIYIAGDVLFLTFRYCQHCGEDHRRCTSGRSLQSTSRVPWRCAV